MVRTRVRINLARGNLAPDCLIQVTNGLTAIAKKKMIHGDIKPDNILLKRLRADAEVKANANTRWAAKITDFGFVNSHVIEVNSLALVKF